jgi:hypothetical protein
VDPFEGRVRISGGGVSIDVHAVIDGLDDEQWQGAAPAGADARFTPGNATVILLEGPRSGQEALATIAPVVPDGLRLVGLESFRRRL